MRRKSAFILAALFSLNSWANGGVSHCNGAEKTVFNCYIKGSKKVASVCEGARLEYRFGPIGSPEFVYPSPDNKRADEENFRYSASRSHNYSENYFKLQFYNDNYAYMAYAVEMRGTLDKSLYESSIIVWKKGKVVKRFVCSNEDAGADLIDLHNTRVWKPVDLEPTN